MTGVSSGGGSSSGGGRMGRGLFTTPPSQLYYGGRGLNIHISTQYLHSIYTVSTQYLHSIYPVSMYIVSTQYLHNIYTLTGYEEHIVGGGLVVVIGEH